MDTNIRCRTLCDNVKLTEQENVKLGKRIKSNYYVHL